jgi:hypothetical protein
VRLDMQPVVHASRLPRELRSANGGLPLGLIDLSREGLLLIAKCFAIARDLLFERTTLLRAGGDTLLASDVLLEVRELRGSLVVPDGRDLPRA